MSTGTIKVIQSRVLRREHPRKRAQQVRCCSLVEVFSAFAWLVIRRSRADGVKGGLQHRSQHGSEGCTSSVRVHVCSYGCVCMVYSYTYINMAQGVWLMEFGSRNLAQRVNWLKELLRGAGVLIHITIELRTNL